jgi:flavin reductase (DIM6/NTAB) family NADH-FMN oxidoreductase RutF
MNEDCLNTLKHMTYGIYVLTTRHETEINGMIASWVTQVSYDPLLIMVAVHPNRYTHHMIEQSGCFALHVLSNTQKFFLARFKGPDPAAKFKEISWTDGKTGCPILRDCIGFFECRVVEKATPGNHTVFVGEVVNQGFTAPQPPLTTLDYEGCYLGKD